MPRKKRGRPPDPHKIEKKNTTLYLERYLVKFVREEIQGLNLSKIANDAIITQILYFCNFTIRQAEIDGDEYEVNRWRRKLDLFEIYLQKRVRKIAESGKKAEIDANYDLMRYKLIREELSPETF